MALIEKYNWLNGLCRLVCGDKKKELLEKKVNLELEINNLKTKITYYEELIKNFKIEREKLLKSEQNYKNRLGEMVKNMEKMAETFKNESERLNGESLNLKRKLAILKEEESAEAQKILKEHKNIRYIFKNRRDRHLLGEWVNQDMDARKLILEGSWVIIEKCQAIYDEYKPQNKEEARLNIIQYHSKHNDYEYDYKKYGVSDNWGNSEEALMKGRDKYWTYDDCETQANHLKALFNHFKYVDFGKNEVIKFYDWEVWVVLGFWNGNGHGWVEVYDPKIQRMRVVEATSSITPKKIDDLFISTETKQYIKFFRYNSEYLQVVENIIFGEMEKDLANISFGENMNEYQEKVLKELEERKKKQNKWKDEQLKREYEEMKKKI